jgi:hypothetical protein
MPGARSARSLAWCVENTRVSHHGHAGSPGIPRAMVFTVSFVISPVTGLFVTVAGAVSCADLNASVGASGPHDFAVRLKRRSSAALSASTASRPASVTIASRPSVGRDARDIVLIWVRRETENFCKQDSTHPKSADAVIWPSGDARRPLWCA